MYKTNMSHSQRQKYLKNLAGLGLVSEFRKENGSVTYRVTQKGLRVLRTIHNMQEALRQEDTVGVLGAELTKTTGQRDPEFEPSRVKRL